jgi:hypothetical protein
MFANDGLLKMSQTERVSYFSQSHLGPLNDLQIRTKVRFNFVCFQKVGLQYSRIEAGAGAE